MDWWIAYSAWKRELEAAKELRMNGFLALCPFERVRSRVRTGRSMERHRVVEIDRPLFSGYFFALDADIDCLRKNRYVTSVLCDGTSTPLRVPDGYMEWLLGNMQVEGSDAGLVSKIDMTRLSTGFNGRVGDNFDFAEGTPFFGHRGKILSLDHLDEKQEVEVEVQIFGGCRVISVQYQSVGPIVQKQKTH